MCSTTCGGSEDSFAAIQKGISSRAQHPISNHVSFDNVSSSIRQFALSPSSSSIPRTYKETSTNPTWCHVVDEEIFALTSRETWEIVDPPIDADVIVCR